MAGLVAGLRSHAPFALFLAALTAFRIAYSGWFELSLDEAYYWLWSLHPSLSYYDHPPMVAWMAWLTGVLGESERALRLGAVLCVSGATWALYRLSAEAFGSTSAGLWAAVIFNLSGIISVGALALTPDAPLWLFSMLALYSGFKIAATPAPRWWYALGAMFGLALLSKYNAALFAPAFFVFLLLSKEHRHWLSRREPYLAFALALVIFMPVIAWNAAHDWVSFRFQFTHGFNVEDRAWALNAAEFWGGQFAVMGLFIFFFVIAAAAWAWREGRAKNNAGFVYLAVMSLALLAFFFANSFPKRMAGNWSTHAYFTAIAAMPGFIAAMGRRGWFNLAWRASLALAALFLVYAHIQIVEPILPMPQKYEISRRIYGWKILAAESDKRLPALGEGAFIVANRYQIATLLTFYTSGHREAYMTNGEGRFGYLGSLARLSGSNALYVTETSRDDIARVGAHFDRCEPSGQVRIERQGELIREFTFHACYNYRGGLIKT